MRTLSLLIVLVSIAAVAESAPVAERAEGPSLMDIALLHGKAGRWAQARTALDKHLAEPQMAAPERVKALAQAISAFALFLLQAEEPHATQPRELIEDCVTRLDAWGDSALHERISACQTLIRLDSARSDLASLEENAANHRRLFHRLPPDRRNREYFGLYTTYNALADLYAWRGEYGKAVRLLNEGLKQFEGDPGAAGERDRIAYDVGRYDQVGKPARPIAAEHWLNGVPANGRLEVEGKVTLLEFTAHWCYSCQQTYPLLEALHREYADRGLQVAFVTELFGRYASRNPVSAEEELAYDADYFLGKHGISFPVAISNASATLLPGPNAANYYVQGVPQIVLIGRDGVIRQVKMGLEKDGEAVLRAEVEKLLE